MIFDILEIIDTVFLGFQKELSEVLKLIDITKTSPSSFSDQLQHNENLLLKDLFLSNKRKFRLLHKFVSNLNDKELLYLYQYLNHKISNDNDAVIRVLK